MGEPRPLTPEELDAALLVVSNNLHLDLVDVCGRIAELEAEQRELAERSFRLQRDIAAIKRARGKS